MLILLLNMYKSNHFLILDFANSSIIKMILMLHRNTVNLFEMYFRAVHICDQNDDLYVAISSQISHCLYSQ